jgi:hypothetical protein
MVRVTEFRSSFANNPGNGRVMNVGNVWEKVMLYLIIQAPKIPGQKPIVGRKVGSGLQLMNGP